jgi:hypothetical protein
MGEREREREIASSNEGQQWRQNKLEELGSLRERNPLKQLPMNLTVVRIFPTCRTSQLGQTTPTERNNPGRPEQYQQREGRVLISRVLSQTKAGQVRASWSSLAGPLEWQHKSIPKNAITFTPELRLWWSWDRWNHNNKLYKIMKINIIVQPQSIKPNEEDFNLSIRDKSVKPSTSIMQ